MPNEADQFVHGQKATIRNGNIRPRAVDGRRRASLDPFLGAKLAFRASSKVPLEANQIEAAKRAARTLEAIIFDGWGFYDFLGRALVLKNGMVDPRASLP